MDSSICIIPARGGSKRIPRKNIKVFNGFPMIFWAIKIAKMTNIFDKIIVSTEDKEISEIAKSYNAEVPFLRPKDLADDYTNTPEVVEFTIQKLQNLDYKFDSVCCIYPTVPLLIKEDIIDGKKKMDNNIDDKFVFAATTFDYPIQRALIFDDDMKSKMLDKRYLYTRSQDLDKTFHDAGLFYWGSVAKWLSKDNILQGGLPVMLPRWRVQDIDNPEDWERAEIIQKLIYQNQK